MPAPIPHGCPPSAVIAASPTLLKMAAVTALLVGGLTLLMSTPPAPSAALPDSCGAVMMALVQSGARDYRTPDISSGYHYSYVPTPGAVNVMAAHSYDTLTEMRENADQGDWQGRIDCRKPVRAQVAALDWPAPVPGITDVVAGVQ